MGRGRLPNLPGLSDLPGISELAGLARHIELRAVSRWVGLGSFVGILAGLAARALYVGFEGIRHLVVRTLAGATLLEPAGEPSLFGAAHDGRGITARRWVLVIAPAIGGFVAAWICYTFCHEARGGNEGWLHAFHNGRGRIRRRVVTTKLVAAAINLGSRSEERRVGEGWRS